MKMAYMKGLIPCSGIVVVDMCPSGTWG